MCLWIWLSNYTSDIKDMMRIMGISATIFVVLIVPEIWKNRRNGAIEIEQASYYTLRQICTARMLMFGVVDLVIIMVFLAITYQTTILSLSDLVVNFFASGKCFMLYMFSCIVQQMGKIRIYSSAFLSGMGWFMDDDCCK